MNRFENLEQLLAFCNENPFYVTGQYLDNIGALYDVHRQVVIESDQDYRKRILIKLQELGK